MRLPAGAAAPPGGGNGGDDGGNGGNGGNGVRTLAALRAAPRAELAKVMTRGVASFVVSRRRLPLSSPSSSLPAGAMRWVRHTVKEAMGET